MPWSRKYSATAVAVEAACTRVSRSLLVATTTTLLRTCPRHEVAFQEVVHFAATFADQARDDHVGIGVPTHHAQHTLLPTPEPAKIPNR